MIRGPIWLLPILTVIIAAVAFTWDVLVPDIGGDSLGRYQKGEPLRIGYALEAPFVTRSEQGEIAGTGPETLGLALSRLGNGRVKWIHADFAALLHELRSGRIDIVCAGMFATADRSRIASFTRPTLEVPAALLVRSGNPLGIRSLTEAAARHEVRVGVLSGSVEDERARALRIPPERLLAFPDTESAGTALSLGEVDLVARSRPALVELTRSAAGAELEVLDDADQGQRGGAAFAVRQDEPRLLAALNDALGEVVGSAAHRAVLARHRVPETDLPAAGTVR